MQLPDAWMDAARKLAGKGGTALVIGRVDAGKSTLIRYLRERASEAGRRVAVVDADIGQASFGPPACMTLFFPPHKPTLRFIGATSPARHLVEVVVGVKRLVERAQADGAALVLIDTSGMVEGRLGHLLKRHKIELVHPETLLVLEKNRELAPLLEEVPHLKKREIMRLPTSPAARSRSAAARRACRQERFAASFQEAHPRWIDLLEPRRILLGEPMEPGALVGLLDPHGETLGLGMVRRSERHRAELQTPLSALERIRFPQVSSLRLGPAWEEIPPRRP